MQSTSTILGAYWFHSRLPCVHCAMCTPIRERMLLALYSYCILNTISLCESVVPVPVRMILLSRTYWSTCTTPGEPYSTSTKGTDFSPRLCIVWYSSTPVLGVCFDYSSLHRRDMYYQVLLPRECMQSTSRIVQSSLIGMVQPVVRGWQVLAWTIFVSLSMYIQFVRMS